MIYINNTSKRILFEYLLKEQTKSSDTEFPHTKVLPSANNVSGSTMSAAPAAPAAPVGVDPANAPNQNTVSGNQNTGIGQIPATDTFEMSLRKKAEEIRNKDEAVIASLPEAMRQNKSPAATPTVTPVETSPIDKTKFEFESVPRDSDDWAAPPKHRKGAPSTPEFDHVKLDIKNTGLVLPGSTGATASTGSTSSTGEWSWYKPWTWPIFEEYDNKTGKTYMTDNYKSKLLKKYQILKEQQSGDQPISDEFGNITTPNHMLRQAGINPKDHAEDKARVAQRTGVGTAIAAGYQDGIEPGRDQIEAQQAELKNQEKIATQPIDDRQMSWDKLEAGAIKSDAEGDTLVGNTGKTRRQFRQERDEAVRLAQRKVKYDDQGNLKVPLRSAPGPNASQYEQDNYQRYLLAQQRSANSRLASWAKEAANKQFLEDNPDFAQMETQKEDDRRKQNRQDWLARNSALRDARKEQKDRIVQPFKNEQDRLEADWFTAPARDATRQKPSDPDFVGPPRFFHDDDGGVRAADGSDPPPVSLGKGEGMVDARYRKFGRYIEGPGANAPDNAFTTYDPTLNAQGQLINTPRSFLKPPVNPKSKLSNPFKNPFNLPSFTPKGIVSNRRSNPNNAPYSPRRETIMASMDYFSQKLKNKYNLIREEIVNPKNAGTMSKKEIASRDNLATKVKAKPIKGKDTEKNAKYRLATFITLRNRKGN